jgi:predicted metal-dependent peptidase
MSIDVEQFMANLRVHLLRTHCFYGNVLAQLPTVFDNKAVPTLGVGKQNKNELLVKLFVNPDYVEHVIDVCNRDKKKVVDHFTEVLKHEIHHLIFEHLTLTLPDRSRQMVATECSVNSYIDRSLLVPEDGQDKAGVFPEDFGLESKLGVHEYYARLEGNKKFMKMRGQEIRKQLGNGKNQKSEEQKKLDELAEEQEQASKDTASGKNGNGQQMEQQDGISDKTQQHLDDMNGQQSGQNGQQSSNSQSGQGQGKGHQKAQQKLQEARDLQDEASDDLNNGNMDDAAEKQHQASKKIQEASDALGEDNGNGKGQGNGQNAEDGDGEGGISMIDSHDMWDSVAGDEITNGMIKDIIRQANETCKQMNSWGNLPGEIKDAIENAYAIEREIVPWEVVLKNFVASSSENILDYTMKRKSKRYDTRPGTKKDDVLSVAIGIDTSGSIDNEMLGVFFNELRWIDKTGTKMTVFEWDTQVNREYDFHEFDGTVSGRGGTDPTDFLETVSERKFDCVIIFTDLYFSNIEKDYNMPMLWICDRGGYSFGNDYDFPVKEGIIMKVNDERDGFEVVRM